MPARLTRTFLDSGVLIAVYNARPELKVPALAVLKDPKRVFLSSPFVRHEVCPKALFNKRHQEYGFYREYVNVPSCSTMCGWFWNVPAVNRPSRV